MSDPDYFQTLPVEIIERILQHLDGRDLVRMSHVCSRIYNIANNHILWDSLIEYDNLVISATIENYISTLLTQIEDTRPESTLLNLPSHRKLGYIIAKKVRKNISRSNFKEGIIPHFSPDHANVGSSDEYLVALETQKMRAWRISGKWVSLISYTKVEDRDPNHIVYQILVVKNLAIVCSSFGENPGEQNFQILQAYSITNGLTRVWERTGLLGTQYQYISSMADKLIKIDKLRETIEVYEVSEQGLELQVTLEQPRHSMRFLNSTLSFNNKYLALAGGLVPENTPVVACWEIESTNRQILMSVKPVCPFRCFKKTAIREDMVYGLLNRFRMIGWDTHSGNVKFSIDLTDSSPGDDEACATWLAIDMDLILTVHQEKDCVTVFSTDGIHLGSIRPLLPEADENKPKQTSVEQVILRGYTAVLRILSESAVETKCEIVTADLTPFLDVLETRRNGSLEAIRLVAYISAEHKVDTDASQVELTCTLAFNTTKILDLQYPGVKFYDYLYTGDRYPNREKCRH